MENWPYTNIHQLNLDWILATVKKFEQEYSGIKTALDEAIKAIEQAGTDTTETAIEALNEAKTAILDAIADAYRDAIADIPADYAAVLAALAQTFSPGNYKRGEIIWYNGDLYYFTTEHSGSWTGTDVKQIPLATYVFERLNDFYSPLENYNIVYSDVPPDNLIAEIDLISGYYINPNNGNVSASADWTCTPYIDVHNYTRLQGKNVGVGAWYDITHTFISSVTIGNSAVDVPNGAYYFRGSVLPANVNTVILCYHEFYNNFAQDYPVTHWAIEKKGYAPGYIHFTVPVNNTVATYNDTAETNHEGTPDYVNVDCVLSLPLGYKPIGHPVKLLMMCHGAGRGVTGDSPWTDTTTYNTLVSMFNTYGYAVFDCNGFNNTELGCSFWGCQKGLEAWRKAYQYIVNNYNVEKDFVIYGFSMGGLTALNLAFQDFPHIKAIALGSPIVDLYKAWQSTDGTKTVIANVYGMGDTWDESKVVGDNPQKHIITINSTPKCMHKLPPIKIWYGGNENGTDGNPGLNKQEGEAFVNAITALGGYAYYREVSGRGHEICYGASTIVNQEILYFLERYARTRDTYY